MLVSIVVDNYNYERFVGTAIESALAQTWPDVEVLVVDDGSTDRSRPVIEKYADRVTTIFKDNGGQGSAFTEAMERVKGDVVVFLDADDTIASDTAARVAEAFTQNPALARVQWPLTTINDEGEVAGPVVPSPSMMRSGNLRDHVLKFRTHVWPSQSGNAYSTSMLRELMPVPDEFAMGSDLYFAESTSVMGPIHSLASPGGCYRVHGSNAWARDSLDAGYIRQKMHWTMASHEYVKKVCADRGVECPDDPREALDVAFVFQRLASLRLDPDRHPLPSDRRLRLTIRGIHAALAHPHHTGRHKAKRVAWLLGVGLGPEQVAHRLIHRFYFRPTG